MTSILDRALWTGAAERYGSTAEAREERARAEEERLEELSADHDKDGVPDATEAWLGTSTFTDESHADGRLDGGGVASIDRLQRDAERGEPAQKSAAELAVDREALGLRVLERGPKKLAGSPLGLLLAHLQDR